MSNSEANQAYFDEWHEAESKDKVAEAVAAERARCAEIARRVKTWASEDFKSTLERDRAADHIEQWIVEGRLP